MFRPALASALVALAACTPTFNWREVRAESMPLKAMLPCKPDKGSRRVSIAGSDLELRVLGCDAGGATFAILYGDVADPARSAVVLGQWKAATLAGLRAAGVSERSFLPAGAMALAQSVRVTASGQQADGSKLQAQAVYFARGSQVVQAMIFAQQLPLEAADTFFAGMGFE
ncbi:MAG: hypothetical protein NVS3B2_09870 [Ramlibacter sp.]